jgi:N-acetylneuraminic acid mutarotase
VGHTATLLDTGKVLVSGGTTTGSGGGLTTTRSAEVFDPVTQTWQPTGDMTQARFGQSATLLKTGRVLVAGGTAGAQGFRTAEIYDPVSGSWTRTGSMSIARENDDICCKAAALLPSGRVLVAGGFNQHPLKSAEIYVPSHRSWIPAASMHGAREGGFSLIPLENGEILAAGGTNNFGAIRGAEVYNGATNTWTVVAPMSVPRTESFTVRLGSTVLVAGGYTKPFATLRTSEIFSP